METMSMQRIERELNLIRKDVEEIKEIVMENELELADDVVLEIEESKKRKKFYSQEEVEQIFCND